MHPKTPKWLQDVLDACDVIVRACEGRTRESFTQDELLKGAVERKFEIIGEALNRISKVDPNTAEQIPEFRRIIGFRNILIHGYDDIDYDRVFFVARRQVLRRLFPAICMDNNIDYFTISSETYST